MKKKTLQRVLSFCLALLLCFTWNIAEPLVANAFAIELSWVTYALISFLAASGFTFAVAGGIEALQAEVEEKVDTYYQVRGIDLYQLIAQTLRFNNNNNGEPSFWFTMAALTAIGEFMEWLKSDDQWESGETVEKTETGTYFRWNYNGVDGDFVCPELGNSGKHNNVTYYELLNAPTLISKSDMGSAGSTFDGLYYFYGFNNNSGNRIKRTAALDSSLNLRWYSGDGSYSTSNSLKTYFNSLGLSYNDDYYLTYRVAGNNDVYSNIYVYLYLPNFPSRVYPVVTSLQISWLDWDGFTVNRSATISVPDTIPEFDIDEDQVVEISFDAFPDNVSFETPEEFAEAIKQQIIDTGTTPSIKTEVKTDPDTVPDVEPSAPPSTDVTPNPDDSEVPDASQYPDIDGLGLPSLGQALIRKFPFSLPFTFATLLEIFRSERQTPKWKVNFPKPLDTTFTIDLSGFETIGTVSRWASVIGYCIALILGTRKFIHW